MFLFGRTLRISKSPDPARILVDTGICVFGEVSATIGENVSTGVSECLIPSLGLFGG